MAGEAVASLFIARVFCVQVVAEHAPVSDVLNVTGDLDAPPVRSAAVQVRNVAVAAPTAVAPALIAAEQVQNAAAPAQTVGAEDLTAAGDHDAVGVRNAAVYPHVARVLGAKVVAHNCGQADRDVAQGSRFVPGVQVARGVPFPLAAGSFPAAPADQFVQAARFSRAAPNVPREFRFPLPAVRWERWVVVALAATR